MRIFRLQGAPVETTKRAELALPPGRWLLELTSEEWWAAPVQLEFAAADLSPEDSAPVAQFEVRPAGRVEGWFTLPREAAGVAALSQSLAAYFYPTPQAAAGSSDLSPGRARCRWLDDEGAEERTDDRLAWRCVVPAETLDLRFQVEDWVPRFLWGVEVAAGATASVGTTDLVAGSAVLGWVVTGDEGALPEARAHLRPRYGGKPSGRTDTERQDRLARSAEVNDRGFFHFQGVAPGAYTLEIAARGYAPSRTSVEVLSDRVTEIADPSVTLSPPHRLEVAVLPPVPPGSAWPKDQATAGLPIWWGRLARLDFGGTALEVGAEGELDEAGNWQVDNLEPGTYLLDLIPQLMDGSQINAASAGTRFSRILEVSDPVTVEIVDLDLVEVTGRVTLGEQPLVADLAIGGRSGTTRIAATSGDDGEFEALVPRRESWRVQVEGLSAPVRRSLEVPLEVREDGDGWMEVHLPATRLLGTVVDVEGEPVPGALVNLSGVGKDPELRVQAYSEEDGSFLIEGYRSGPVRLNAEAPGDRSSETLELDLAGDEDTGPVELEVRPRRAVRGALVSRTGPVPGGRVLITPVGVPVMGRRTVISDAAGRFRSSVPVETEEVVLTVAAPGQGLRLLRAVLPEGDLVVPLEPTWGTLRLELDPAPERGVAGPVVLVLRDGAWDEAWHLQGLAEVVFGEPRNPEADAGNLRLDHLEPGSYRVCWMSRGTESRQRLQSLAEAPAVPESCAEGYLPAGGELTLALEMLQSPEETAP